MVILNINDRLLELPSRHLAVEENIQLAITPPLELGQTEVRADETDRRSATPNISALACQIPAGRVQHLTGQVDHGDFGDVVCASSDAGGEGAESHGARLGDDGVGDGTEGAGVDEGDEDAEDGLGVVCGATLGDGGADAEEDEEGEVDGGAVEEDGATAGDVGEGDGAHGGYELEARVDEAELEGEVGLRGVSQSTLWEVLVLQRRYVRSCLRARRRK